MKTIQAANSKNISRASQKVPKSECIKLKMKWQAIYCVYIQRKAKRQEKIFPL